MRRGWRLPAVLASSRPPCSDASVAVARRSRSASRVEQAVALHAGEPVTQLSLPVGEGGGEHVPGSFVGGGELAGEGAEWAAEAGGAVGAGVDDAVKAGGQVVPVGDGGELLLSAQDEAAGVLGHGEDEVLPVGEVVVQLAFAGVGPAQHVVDAGGGDAVGQHQLGGRGDDALPGRSATGGRRCGVRHGWTISGRRPRVSVGLDRSVQHGPLDKVRSSEDGDLGRVPVHQGARRGARSADGLRRRRCRGSDRVAPRQPDVELSVAQRDPPPGRVGPLRGAGPDRDGRLGQAPGRLARTRTASSTTATTWTACWTRSGSASG